MQEARQAGAVERGAHAASGTVNTPPAVWWTRLPEWTGVHEVRA
jgi:hypothetical protein